METSYRQVSIVRTWGTFWPVASVRWLNGLLLTWQERANQRHQLAQLDQRLLRDVGIGRAEVADECRKPFWRA